MFKTTVGILLAVAVIIGAHELWSHQKWLAETRAIGIERYRQDVIRNREFPNPYNETEPNEAFEINYARLASPNKHSWFH